MKYLSVCSGVEAATQAWLPLGWQAVAFSEIEPFPSAVLAYRFPDVPNLGDMTKITYNKSKEILSNGTTDVICAGGIDLLVGGTPCQSFSLAGKREGLEGASGLAYHFIRLLREIRPRWFVWENVPGALSSISDGRRDFNFLVRQYAECGYDIEWRVLDTQYVRTPRYPRAIPQRRRRVFVVGHLADAGAYPSPVLLEQAGVCGYPAPRRIKASCLAGCTGSGTAPADGIFCYPLNSMCFNKVAKDGDRQTTGIGEDGDPLPTLQANHHHACAYGINPQNGSQMFPCTKEVGQTLTVGHCGGVATEVVGADLYNHKLTGDAAATLSTESGTVAGHSGPSVIGVDYYNNQLTGDVFKTLNSAASDKDHTGGIVSCFNTKTPDQGIEFAPTLPASGYKEPHAVVLPTYTVRRITPIEGERLQGFADNWTQISWHGKPADQCPDGPRFKAIGNSMSVNVMEWIGLKIMQAERRAGK